MDDRTTVRSEFFHLFYFFLFVTRELKANVQTKERAHTYSLRPFRFSNFFIAKSSSHDEDIPAATVADHKRNHHTFQCVSVCACS